MSSERVRADHQRLLLSQAIWWYTECDGKFTTRYRTSTVVSDAVVPIRHEHVVQRRGQVIRMLSDPDRVEAVMAQNLACIVSTDEHKALDVHADLDGWARYAAAGIEVRDMADGSILDLSPA